MTLTVLMRRLEIPAVPHGFRSSFRNWVEECTVTPWSVAESALAHKLKDKSAAAYMTSDIFELRRGLMQKWADYLAGEERKDGEVLVQGDGHLQSGGIR